MTFITQLAQTYPVYNTYSAHTDTTDPKVVIAVYLILLAFFIVFYAVNAFLLGRVFRKTGTPAWIAWVPFYSTWKLLELGDQKGWWSVLRIIPFVNYVAAVFVFIAEYRIGLKFGKEGWWVVLAIFVPIVWVAILAFDKSTWDPNRVIAPQPPVAPTPAA